MSIKVVRYNPEKTYLLNSGEAGTPERMLQEYPAIRDFLHVIDTDPSEQLLMSCDPLAGLRVVYQLDPALSDDEAIAAMEVIRNAPPPDPEPDVNERLAAAMEFQNILTMAAMTEGGGTE